MSRLISLWDILTKGSHHDDVESSETIVSEPQCLWETTLDQVCPKHGTPLHECPIIWQVEGRRMSIDKAQALAREATLDDINAPC